MLETVNRYVLGTVVPWLLVGVGLYFLLYLRGKPLGGIRCRGSSSQAVRSSSFRAVCLALAGTLGVGNLAGVAGAVAMGGAGAVFWMWVSAIFAMILKYAEVVLAMRHRKDGHGSTMDTIRQGCASRGHPLLGRVVASLFAVLFLGTALSMGSGLQANAVAHTLSGVLALSPLSVGLGLGAALLLSLCRGREGILWLCARLVPLMTLLYVVLSAAVLILRADRIVSVFGMIVSDAFAPDAALGGVGGFLLSRKVRFGVMRGLISNEAGCGTAPTAHASADGVSARQQGRMGMVEVAVDTLLLCSLTAFVLLLGEGEGESFMMMTVNAFASVLGDFVTYPLALAVLCFGFATLVCWAHYGAECVLFLTKSTWLRGVFYLCFVGMVILGSLTDAILLWQLADLAIGMMTVINLIALIAMRREIKEETEQED